MISRTDTYRIVVLVLLTAVGLNALFAGLCLIVQPDGSIIGLPIGILSSSPFRNFFIPGLFLSLFNGVLNIVVAVLTYKKINHYPRLITFQGIILMVWIVMQMSYLREVNFLQLTMLILGMFLILAGESLNT